MRILDAARKLVAEFLSTDFETKSFCELWAPKAFAQGTFLQLRFELWETETRNVFHQNSPGQFLEGSFPRHGRKGV